jgi:NTP pyrophosphatase (non-canonical NTP hydrolase)
MDIAEIQRHIWRIYKHHDTKRGIERTFKWFESEVKELNHAIKEKNSNIIIEEIADVLAWLVSIANLLEIDIGKAFTEKYGEGCPKCSSIPCQCSYREAPD